MLQLENVSIAGSPNPLKHASFRAPVESFVSLIVEDESILPIIADTLTGERAPDEGRVLADSIDISQIKPSVRRKRLASLPDDPRGILVPGFSVMENLALTYSYGEGHPFRRAPGRQDIALFRAALEPLNLAQTLDMPLSALNVEQRCLLALRVVLLAQPKILVVVEPRTVLDEAKSRGYLRAVWKLTRTQKVTTILLTLNERSAKAFGDRCYRVSNGQFILEPITEEAASLS
ncbi:hypothetical protein AGMMS49992_10060 [Clostridia bacterium]|nr:hypothetical protein AGMMS49992_10060 [Clostridia bacterium]